MEPTIRIPGGLIMPIIDYTPPTPLDTTYPYWSSFNRGTATILLNLGHGEYGFATNDQLTQDEWDPFDCNDEEPDGRDRTPPSWVTDSPSDWDADFGMRVRLEGPVLQLWKTFYDLANQLDPEQDPADYTPGGDDDTYDSYPSAFECLVHFAEILDELERRFIDAIPAQDRAPGTMNENIGRRFTARHRIESIVASLLIQHGPFWDWDFEDYARPFLTTDPAKD